MENRKNTGAIIIIVLLILLIGTVVFMICNMHFTNKQVIMSNPQANNGQNGTNNIDIDNIYKELKEELENKNKEIATLKENITKKDKEIESLKSENKTTTVVKNEYVALKSENITPNKNWKIQKLVSLPCIPGRELSENETATLYFKMTSEGKVEAYGDVFASNKDTYTVKNLTKKVVSLETPRGGQDLTTFCFAIMEDGTLEQIVLKDGELKSLGTISGISNVVRVESLSYGQGYYPIVVQGNGKAIMLDSNTNKNFTWKLGYWE